MNRYEVKIRNKQTGEKIETFTYAENLEAAMDRIREELHRDNDKTWKGWTALIIL